jgi:hypothetical protein
LGGRLIVRLVLILATFVAFSATSEEAPIDDTTIRTDSTTTSTVTTQSDTTTTLKSPPASAITPTINTSNSDLCTFGVAGAVQTQILGISMGTQVTDENCERLKLSKTLYDMGMKVAAVSTLCQDERVFNAMLMAGTPCPFEGLIGDAAKAAWEVNEQLVPSEDETSEEAEEGITDGTKTIIGSSAVAGLLLLLLL